MGARVLSEIGFVLTDPSDYALMSMHLRNNALKDSNKELTKVLIEALAENMSKVSIELMSVASIMTETLATLRNALAIEISKEDRLQFKDAAESLFKLRLESANEPEAAPESENAIKFADKLDRTLLYLHAHASTIESMAKDKLVSEYVSTTVLDFVTLIKESYMVVAFANSAMVSSSAMITGTPVALLSSKAMTEIVTGPSGPILRTGKDPVATMTTLSRVRTVLAQRGCVIKETGTAVDKDDIKGK